MNVEKIQRTLPDQAGEESPKMHKTDQALKSVIINMKGEKLGRAETNSARVQRWFKYWPK